MTKLCQYEGCNHPKTKHERTLDRGSFSGRCTVNQCPCSYELFGYTSLEHKKILNNLNAYELDNKDSCEVRSL